MSTSIVHNEEKHAHAIYHLGVALQKLFDPVRFGVPERIFCYPPNNHV